MRSEASFAFTPALHAGPFGASLFIIVPCELSARRSLADVVVVSWVIPSGLGALRDSVDSGYNSILDDLGALAEARRALEQMSSKGLNDDKSKS